jgi:DNA/RNA endonuclease YhcR with UshA esterase domain
MHRAKWLLTLGLFTAIGCSNSAPAPTGPVIINASDKVGITAAMPTVTVVGTVDNVAVTDSVVTINFKDTTDSKFYAVVLRDGREAVEAAFNGDIAAAITGKTVHVTGNIVPYRGRPEIVISKPEQLTVIP